MGESGHTQQKYRPSQVEAARSGAELLRAEFICIPDATVAPVGSRVQGNGIMFIDRTQVGPHARGFMPNEGLRYDHASWKARRLRRVADDAALAMSLFSTSDRAS